MATVAAHLPLLTGQTLTLKLYPRASGSIANGASGDALSEAGVGYFTATVAESLTGVHRADILQGSTLKYQGWLDMSQANPVVDELLESVSDAVDGIAVAPPVSLVVGSVLPRVWSQDIEAFVGEEALHTLIAVNNRGVAQDLSGIAAMTLTIRTKGNSPTVIQTVLNAALDRTSDSTGVIRFTNGAAVTESARTLQYILKNDSGNVRIMQGDFVVRT